jgi:hypothetical protein
MFGAEKAAWAVTLRVRRLKEPILTTQEAFPLAIPQTKQAQLTHWLI